LPLSSVYGEDKGFPITSSYQRVTGYCDQLKKIMFIEALS